MAQVKLKDRQIAERIELPSGPVEVRARVEGGAIAVTSLRFLADWAPLELTPRDARALEMHLYRLLLAQTITEFFTQLRGERRWS